jgi:enterochelin esterase-like enzyme
VLSRRTLLLGGAAAVVGAGGALEVPGISRRVFGNPSSSHPVPTGQVGVVESGSFRSAAMSATTGWSIAWPAARGPMPFLLVLHGKSNDHRDVLGSHRLGAFLSDAVRRGTTPFALAAVDGGDYYWHPRRSGVDPQRMILEELLPVLADRGLKTDRFALGGWSMGGYGALLLAERLGPARVAAVAVDSPALFLKVGDSSKGAFDGSADFAAHDVIASAARLSRIPVRVSCGTSDPFLPGVRKLLSAVPSAGRDLDVGAHDVAWWQHAAPAQLAFVGQHL